MPFCESCGTKTSAKFCGSCGAKQTQSEGASSELMKLEVDHGDVKPRLPASTLLDRARLVLFGDAVALREGHVDPQDCSCWETFCCLLAFCRGPNLMCGFSHRSLCVKRCFLPVFLPILFIILFIFVPRLPPITDIEFDKIATKWEYDRDNLEGQLCCGNLGPDDNSKECTGYQGDGKLNSYCAYDCVGGESLSRPDFGSGMCIPPLSMFDASLSAREVSVNLKAKFNFYAPDIMYTQYWDVEATGLYYPGVLKEAGTNLGTANAKLESNGPKMAGLFRSGYERQVPDYDKLPSPAGRGFEWISGTYTYADNRKTATDESGFKAYSGHSSFWIDIRGTVEMSFSKITEIFGQLEEDCGHCKSTFVDGKASCDGTTKFWMAPLLITPGDKTALGFHKAVLGTIEKSGEFVEMDCSAVYPNDSA